MSSYLEPERQHHAQSIACFTTSHGFGHATRTVAVLQALAKISPGLTVHVFSTLPDWFWKDNLSPNVRFRVHQIETDIGLVQKSPFEHDLEQTIDQLEQFLSFDEEALIETRKRVRELDPDLILCDISPLGLVLGEEMDIPTVLIENFTWDWIYEAYLGEDQRLKPLIAKLKAIFNSATLRIQTNPLCDRIKSTPLVPPIFREFRDSPSTTLQKLGFSPASRFLLVTTGGIPQDFAFLDKLSLRKDLSFVIAGNFHRVEKTGNLTFLPYHSDFHFPDLVHASSGVVGKLGYGTVAEAWGAQTPLLGVYRQNFRESIPLQSFVRENIPNLESTQQDFLAGKWIKDLDEFLALEKKSCIKNETSGALETVDLIKAITS